MCNTLKQGKLCLFGIIMLLITLSGFGQNLLPNADFSQITNGIPDNWYASQDASVISVISGSPNAVRISENSTSYVPALVTTVNVDGNKQFYLSFDVKTESLHNNARVYYYWLDANGSVIGNEHYALTLTGTNDWQNHSSFLIPDDPVNTAKLKLVMAVYSSSGNSGYAEYKNPVLREAPLDNLLPNPYFKGVTNGLPASWYYSQDPSVMTITAGSPANTLEISEDSTYYVPSMVTTINVDGSKQYNLSIEMKTSSISNLAKVYYYWLDANNAAIGSAKTLKSLSGTNDWSTYQAVITPDDPVNTAKLKVVMGVYSSSGNTGKAYFRLPAVRQLWSDNMLPNSDFTAVTNGIPDDWYASQDASVIEVLTCSPSNILSLAEDSSSYVPALVTSVSLSGQRQYFLSVDAMAQGISNDAAIYYYWLDWQGNIIGNAHFLTHLSGTCDWDTYYSVIVPEDTVNTCGVRVVLAVYGLQLGGGKVFYMNPLLREAYPDDGSGGGTTQEDILSNSCFTGPDSLTNTITSKSPSLNFIMREGVPAPLNLMTRNGVVYSNPLTITLTIPDTVDQELYLYRGADQACIYVAPDSSQSASGVKTVTYDLPSGYKWNVMGNSLLLKPASGCPSSFNIGLVMTAADNTELVNITIPAAQTANELTGDIPTGFSLYTWYSYPVRRATQSDFDNRMIGDLYDDWKLAGFKGGAYLPQVSSGWQAMIDYTGSVYYYKPGKDVSASVLPNLAATSSGGVFDKLFCPESLIDKASGYFDELGDAYPYQSLLSDSSIWQVVDFEPYNYGWVTTSCFCQTCRESFAQYASLGYTPGSTTILGSYLTEWCEFRCAQRAGVIEEMVTYSKIVNPQGKFVFCSMPMPTTSEENDFFKYYGIDLRLYDSFVDLHAPMHYEIGLLFYQRLERTLTVLNKPVIPVLAGYKHTDNPERLMQQTLAAAMLGAEGVYYWRGCMQFDGNAVQVLGKAMKALYECESYITNGQLNTNVSVTPAQGSEDILYSVSRKYGSDQALILLINDSSSSSASATVAFQTSTAQNYHVYDIISGSYLQSGGDNIFSGSEINNGFSVNVGTLSSALLRITPIP